MSVFNKLAAVFRKRDLDQELDAELAAHLEMATEELLQSGLSPAEARRQARVKLGGLEQAKEAHREARGIPGLEKLWQDLTYAARTLRRDSSFTVFAVLILGLGVGASSTVFSIVNTVLVRPLPFKDPERLVWIANGTKTEDSMSGRTIQVNLMKALRERNRSFEDIAAFFAFYTPGGVSFTGQGEPEKLTSVPVSEGFFPLLGVQPMLGHQFTAAECQWKAPPVAMLSHGFWQRRFASDPSIIGKAIRLDDQLVTIVGVMPASFDFPAVFAPGIQVDVFQPFPLTNETNRWGNTLTVVGHLKPGATLPSAQAEATILNGQINADFPQSNGINAQLTFLKEQVSGKIRPALLILAAAVGVVMLIVCANLSNLILARTQARHREMAIRTALGAGPGRLIRQVLTESLLLTGLGAALGIAIAVGATNGISRLTAFNVPLLSAVAVDGGVLAFTLAIAVLTGLILSLAPVWQVSASRLSSTLSQRSSSGSHENSWVWSGLVVSEIAFAAVLLVGAGLLTRSLLQVMDVDLGFRPQSAAALRLDASSQYNTMESRIAWLNDALDRVRTMRGVDAAGMTDALPLGRNRTWGAGEKGKTYPRGQFPLAFVRLVTDGYAKAMGLTLKQGRDITPQDTKGSTQVMLINETMARTRWPGESPLGKVLSAGCGPTRETVIVGVVADVRHMALEKESGTEMYLPMRQCGDSLATGDLVVRSSLPLAELSAGLEERLRPIAPDLPKASLRPLTQLVDRAVSPRRFMVLLLTGFAGFALLLASLGIYGLISYSVTRRTQEIGIRMALGESAAEVQKRIVLRTLGLAGVGIAMGAIVSRAVTGSINVLLFQISPGDPAAFVGAALLMVAIAAIAGYVPARRASKVDPMICLRAE